MPPEEEEKKEKDLGHKYCWPFNKHRQDVDIITRRID